jgi:hypothetical protein
MTRWPAMFGLFSDSRRCVTLDPWGTGERIFVWCAGGPAVGRAVQFPPPLEIAVDGGIYVLVDDGPPEHWRYEFVPTSH